MKSNRINIIIILIIITIISNGCTTQRTIHNLNPEKGVIDLTQIDSEVKTEYIKVPSSWRYKAIIREAIIFGGLIFVSIYHLALYLYRKNNKSALYFGLFCLLVGIRTFFVGERLFIYLFPNFNWEIAHKIQTNTYYLAVPLLLMFLRSIFPKYFNKKMIRISQIIGGAFWNYSSIDTCEGFY